MPRETPTNWRADCRGAKTRYAMKPRASIPSAGCDGAAEATDRVVPPQPERQRFGASVRRSLPCTLLALCIAALALAACNNYNPNCLYGCTTPTPTASTGTPNPKITAATVTVEYSSSPLPNQTVTLSNDVNGTIGSAITAQTTNSSGQTTFSNLTGAAFYCFSASYTPTGSLPQQQSYCGQFWQNGVTLAF
jgi:hypothetical protein